MRLQAKDIEQAPQNVLESHGYIKGIAKINEKLVILLDVTSLLGGSNEKSEHLTTTTAKSKETKIVKKSIQDEKPQQIENSIPANTQKPSDEIPPELAEVFNEDTQGILPTQIIREAETISEI
jgi:purine-binding chemotaxis protein CheW